MSDQAITTSGGTSGGVAATDVRSIPPIKGREASELADREYGRFLDVVRSLSGDDWEQPTDCELWNVRQIVAHQVGHGESWASMREFLRQTFRGLPQVWREGAQMVDATNAVQVREREMLPPSVLVERLEAVRPGAVRGRSRRRWMRPLRFNTPGIGWTSVGTLYDVILTRDTWMHRADICRATGREMLLTADHDGRIIADIVADWARLHGQPFTLELTGPAGGSFPSGDTHDAGARLALDAVEFARIVSGRAFGDGLLAQPVLF